MRNISPRMFLRMLTQHKLHFYDTLVDFIHLSGSRHGGFGLRDTDTQRHLGKVHTKCTEADIFNHES